MEKYSRGRRGAPAKGVGRVTGAKVQILSSPPKNSIAFAMEFFYPSRSRDSPKRACRALGVPVGLVYHHRAKRGVYHQPLWGCISSRASVYFLRLDDIQCSALMIYRNKLRMIYKAYALIYWRKCGIIYPSINKNLYWR